MHRFGEGGSSGKRPATEKADASLVLAVQMLRLFAVVLAGALLGRLWSS